MLFRRRKAKYEYLAGQSAICLLPGCSGVLDHVEVRANGDILYYRGGNRTHFLTFEIADYDGHSDSRKHGLPSADRLRAYDKAALAALARITGIPEAELREARDLEVSSELPQPAWQ